jgi:hypothetical protein
MSDNQKTLIYGTLFVGFIGTLYYFMKKEESKLAEIGARTVATISQTSGDRMNCNFTVDGKNYIAVKNVRDQYLNDGEQYYILYDPTEPNNHTLLLYSEPFLNSELEWDTTNVSSIDKPIQVNSNYRFTYSVNGQTFTRFQEPPAQFEDMELITSLPVVYRSNKPEIGYILFN